MSEIQGNHDASVGIADALWTRRDIPPNAPFVRTLQQRYGARAQALDFGDPSAAATINAWTKAHTLGLIDRIVDRTASSDFLYLTNALSFKGTWMLPFKKSETHPMPFTNANGSKRTVQMMSRAADYAIYDAPTFSALRLPYGQGGFAAYILLPHNNNVASLLQSLTAAGLDTIARNAQQTYVAVSMPRFTARFSASLIPVLRSMGMGIAFSGRADFSAIHAAPPALAISSVNHAAYVRVDEQVTTAAAATSVGISMLAIRQPQRTFVVDRPFVLALRDERTGALLFIGVIRTLSTPNQ
jgi:serpin B